MWCSGVTSVDFGWYSSIVGTRPFAGPCACARVPASRSISSNANSATPLPTNGIRLRRTQLRDFIVTYPNEALLLRRRISFLHSGDSLRHAPWLGGLLTATLPPCTRSPESSLYCKHMSCCAPHMPVSWALSNPLSHPVPLFGARSACP